MAVIKKTYASPNRASKVAPAGQFESGGTVPVTCPPWGTVAFGVMPKPTTFP